MRQNKPTSLLPTHTASTPPPLQFSPRLTQISVRETFVARGFPRPAEGFVVVRCIDSIGVPTSGAVTYNIVDSDPGPFLLNATTGRLSVTADLDYETMTSYSFAVACVNISDPNIRGMGMVRIDILPVNEFEPVIMPRTSRIITLSENTPVGTTIASTEPGGMLRYSVTDRDDGPDGNITFTLSGGSQDNTENARFFDLNFFTGALVLRQRLDVDNVPNAFDRVSLRISACDVYPVREGCPNFLVNMIVFSANDNSPQFSSDTYEVSYPESIPVGTPIITAVCTDSDRGAGQFAGIEIYQPTSELWQLPNATNGTVVLNMSLDYETAQMHQFTLRCYDTGGREDFATVRVNVLPVNDNLASTLPPLQFNPRLIQISVKETFVAGGSPRPAEGFVTVRCIDSIGVPTSGAVTYNIVDSDPGPFLLNATTGRLSITADLDYETMTSYSFAVACVNISDSNITGMGMVRIDVQPVNEFEPVIMPRTFRTITLFENTPVGTTVTSTEPGGMLRYSVTDRDDGPDGNITFTLSEGSNTENARFFDLNFFTGALVLRQRLDVDNVPNAFDRVSLRIVACDMYPPGEECPNLLVNMIVFSSNDNSPRFSSDTYEVSYPESIPVGTPIITAVCTDSDRGAGEFAGIEIYQPTSELWRLPNATNGVVVLNMSLDYETAQMHEFRLRCFDTGGREDFSTVTVNVLPFKPVFSQPSYAFTVNRISTPSNDLAIGMVTALDRDLNGRITYSLEDNENFRITNDGRILLVDYILVLEGNSFNLTVTAHDGEFNAMSAVYITVTGLLSIPEIVLVGLAGLILLVLVVIISCCVMYCCFKRQSR